MKSTDIIPVDLIDRAERKCACSAALGWLRESPRTWQELADYCCSWFEWAVRNLGMTAIPEGLAVGGDLDLFGCPALTAIPEGLTVGGSLCLRHCPTLTIIPESLTVGGDLDLSGCPATIPADIKVRGKIYR